MSQWESVKRDTGRENFFSLNIEKCSDLTGDEIYFDFNSTDTYISSFFLAKWKDKNKNTAIILNNGGIFTSIVIAGKTYPIYMKLRENGFFPLVLGQDFFDCYKWSYIPGENIKTPFGEMYVEEEQSGGRAIDVNLCEQVYQAEQELKKEGVITKTADKIAQIFWSCQH